MPLDWKNGDGYSEAVCDAICEKIMSGLYLPTICRMEGFPPRSNVYLWLGTYPEFEKRYAAACRVRAYADADECEEIASGRWRNRDGQNLAKDDMVWVQRDRLMLYAKEKQMAWSNPTRYGAVKVDMSVQQIQPAKVIELCDDPGHVEPVGQD